MDIVVSLLFYIVPLVLLISICICCALVREHRRTQLIIRNQHNMPGQNSLIIPIQTSLRGDDDHFCTPPPYTAECHSSFEESLPSYERATGRSS